MEVDVTNTMDCTAYRGLRGYTPYLPSRLDKPRIFLLSQFGDIRFIRESLETVFVQTTHDLVSV
jgi:hypothetical protein